jgi:periplasmic divalent cation tolerance protein
MADIDACVVMTTAPDKEQAERIAMAVLEARLAACVQIQAITSYYWWEEKIENSDEQLIYLKTTKDKYETLEAAILKIHPYDTPEILCLPVVGGLEKYLTWMVRETTQQA